MRRINRLDIWFANLSGLGVGITLGWMLTLPLFGASLPTTVFACIWVTIAVWGRHAQKKIVARVDEIRAEASGRPRGPDGELRVNEQQARELRLLGHSPPVIKEEE